MAPQRERGWKEERIFWVDTPTPKRNGRRKTGLSVFKVDPLFLWRRRTVSNDAMGWTAEVGKCTEEEHLVQRVFQACVQRHDLLGCCSRWGDGTPHMDFIQAA